MRLEDFKIGEYFWSGAGQWLCTDIGTRSIVALKVKEHKAHFVKCDDQGNISEEGSRPIPWEQVVKMPELYGTETVFWYYDFGGCSLENDWEEE